MPTTMGVYTAGLTAGTEVSSTYEGRHLTVLESELIHPVDATASDFVHSGDPVIIAFTQATRPHAIYGKMIGVAFTSATAVGDLIAVDTEGIFNLMVYADDDLGESDVNPGDDIYISDDSAGTLGTALANGTGDAVLSKRRNLATQRHFGTALGIITGGAFGVIAVKVHFDPLDDQGVLFGDLANPEVGEDNRSFVASRIHYDGTGGTIWAANHRVMYSDVTGTDAPGNFGAVYGTAGILAGATIGGAGTVYMWGIEGRLDVHGATIDNAGASYFAGVRAVMRGTAASIANVNIITALSVANNIATNLAGFARSSLVCLRNDGGTLTSIFNIAVQNVTYFMAFDGGAGGTVWAGGGTDCTASGATDPSGTLIGLDPLGNPFYIRCWAAA